MPVQSVTHELLQSRLSVPTVVYFWAPWCGPCKTLGPTMEQVAEEFASQVQVLKVDLDAEPNAAAEFGIRNVPTLLLFKDGKPVDQRVGAQPKSAISKWLTESLA